MIMADLLKTKLGEKAIKEIPCIKTKQEKSKNTKLHGSDKREFSIIQRISSCKNGNSIKVT